MIHGQVDLQAQREQSGLGAIERDIQEIKIATESRCKTFEESLAGGEQQGQGDQRVDAQRHKAGDLRLRRNQPEDIGGLIRGERLRQVDSQGRLPVGRRHDCGGKALIVADRPDIAVRPLRCPVRADRNRGAQDVSKFGQGHPRTGATGTELALAAGDARCDGVRHGGHR